MTANSTHPPGIHILPPLTQAERVLALDCEAILGPAIPGAVHRRPEDLDADLLAQTRPDLVIMPLFTADQDAMALIEALVALGYMGKVAVLAPTLPNPRLVERELRGLGLRVTLISP